MINILQKPKRILLTGGTGQVGWELQRSLMPLGEVIAPTRKQFNLADPESLRKKIQEWRPDLIINAAAYTAVDQAEDEPELAYAINAKAPRVIAEEAEKQKIPLIHYSTDYIFDGTKETPYLEEDTPNPINVYGESKLKGEWVIKKIIDQHLILRTSWVYSYRGNNFLNTMLRLFEERDEIKVVDDQIGAPTSARLIAESTVALFKGNNRDFGSLIKGTYHMTAGGSTSWYGVAKEIFTLQGNDIHLSIIPTSSAGYAVKARRPLMSLLDNHKILSVTKNTQTDWKKAMALEVSAVIV
jgi:dTDP-4-dehydrorhamnose reductase